jgi:hypothetical protein
VAVGDPATSVAKWARQIKPESWTTCIDEIVSQAVAKVDADVCQHVTRTIIEIPCTAFIATV